MLKRFILQIMPVGFDPVATHSGGVGPEFEHGARYETGVKDAVEFFEIGFCDGKELKGGKGISFCCCCCCC
jgi:hypothetical protein